MHTSRFCRQGSCKPPASGWHSLGAERASSSCVYRPGPGRVLSPDSVLVKADVPCVSSLGVSSAAFHGRAAPERGWQPAVPGPWGCGASATNTFPHLKCPLSPTGTGPIVPL